MRHRIDRRVESFGDGRVLVGGDPVRLLRLSAAGAAVVARWRDAPVPFDDAALRPSEAALLDRLVVASMAHPAPDAAAQAVPPVVVVPVRDRPVELERCLRALVASGVTRVVVVDDGSRHVAAHRRVVEAVGPAVELVERPVSGGPAAARMSGWAALSGDVDRPELVAFVDSDVVATPRWWVPLVDLLADERVGLVAPRVVHGWSPAVADRYEVAASPLDLGADPAPIVAGTRVSYVPAAALVVRSAAFAAVGGFDESLVVGEDVDLVWRLADAGWRCRYEPSAVVTHTGRSRLGEMARRRFDYGRSAALLDTRHPGRVPPVRGSRWSWAVAALALGGHPLVAALVAAGNVATLRRRLGDVPEAGAIAARLVARGHAGFARQLARALVRPWWPLTLAALLVAPVLPGGRRLRRRLVAAAMVPPLLAYRERRPAVPLPWWVALWWADDAAYSAGVWAGCRSAGTTAPLRPTSGD